MNYNEAINFIKAKQSLGIKPGLSRINYALSFLGNPQNDYKVIHIAGTNGKGTVCAMTSNALIKSGYKVGMFSSPWTIDYREQFQINGDFISEKKFAYYVTLMKDFELTEFELAVAICLKYFSDEKIDYAVIECGMGGKGDATNVFNNIDVAVITSISLDHTAFLGDTVEKITLEKSGIIKPKSDVVLYPNNKNVIDIIIKRCNDVCANLYQIPYNIDHNINNENTANMVLKCLGVNSSVIKPVLPARQEMIDSDFMIDGAHNADGAVALKRSLPLDKNITAVVAMMKDKDVNAYMATIAPLCNRIIITTVTDNPRAMTAEDLKKIAVKYNSNIEIISNPFDALTDLKNCDGFKLICGSFYLARQIRKYLI